MHKLSFVNSFANPRIKHSISKERNKITVKIGLSPQIHTPCCGYGLALLNPKEVRMRIYGV